MSRYDELRGFAPYRLLRAIKRLVVFMFFLLIIGGIAFVGFYFYLQSKPLPNGDIKQTSLIYSVDGKVIDSIDSGEKRIYVPLAKIPQNLIHATLAIEDRKFYSHFGFDFVRIGGAIVADLKNGAKVQGASTISQQLAKNLYLSHEKTWERKIEEAVLTSQLELKYSKDQILEMYLNQIFYGGSAYGVQLAATTYFNKDVYNLNLAESAMLAGIPKGPTYYSPFKDMEKAKNRQKQVLQSMVSEGYISQHEADSAYGQQLLFANPNDHLFVSKAPYFTQYIQNELINHYDITEQELHSGGLKIYTSLDLSMQEAAEKLIQDKFPKNRPLQAALISIEPSTGFIRTMIGGRNYLESQYNRVFAKRQAGSSFKPFVYLAALENGVTPLTKQKSEATVFLQNNGQEYQPENFDSKYANQDVDLRYAITRSDNIYAVKTHTEIGMEKTVEMAKKLGINSTLDPVPSLALGSNRVTPFEMTSAYATIANQGKRIEPTAILKIEDEKGNILYEKKDIEETQVIPASEAFVMTYLLEGVFEPGGTASSVANLIKRPVAGKTGTSNNYRDLWLVGYTPQLVTAFWTGYDDDKILEKYQNYRTEESHLTKAIWAEYMEKAHQSLAPQLFTVPDGVVSLYIDPKTGKIANDHCPSPRLEVFLKGTEPTEICDIHKGNQLIDSNKMKETDQRTIWSRMKNWWND